MRNDIINEQTNYLNGLVAIGGLIGNPRCEFLATSNSIDNIVEGKFVWDINTTETNPAKVIEAKIAFTTEGLLAYTA
jgi:phage tail sheath protein FI